MLMQPEPADALKSYLTENETLIWSGRPVRYFVVTPISLGVSIFGVLWLVGSMNTIIKYAQTSSWQALLCVPLILLGLFLVFGHYLKFAFLRKKTVYGLTNRRVLFLKTGTEPKCYAKNINDLETIKLKAYNDGLGDVLFGQEPIELFDLISDSVPATLSHFQQLPDSLSVYHTLLELKGKGEAQTTSPTA